MIQPTLDKLTKEDLIVVIANMQNAIDSWSGHGFSIEDGDILVEIGTACMEHCKQTDDWELPKV